MNKFLEFKSRSKLQKKQLRSANNIDLLRLIAALSIVWFHNPLYWNISSYLFKSTSSRLKVDFGFSSHIIMIFGAILVIGFANLLIKSLSPDLQKYITFLIAFTSFLFFIGLNKLATCKSPIFMYLSEMGQKYSFGIFICHQACYDIFTRFINNFFGSLHINNPLIQYLSLGSVIMIVSFLTTVIFYRYLPRLFHY